MKTAVEPLLELKLAGITKRFPGVLACSDVAMEIRRGEVLALVGENGAGKSTLTKIIAGLIRPSQGRMVLRGAPFAPASRQEAEQHGIRMVLQELGLIPTLTVAENLMLDHMPRLGGFIRRDEMNERARQMMANIGLEDIAPRTLVGKLGLGRQQMVEIARNLVGDCQLLILDEPTAMLTSREIDHLFSQIAGLKRRILSLCPRGEKGLDIYRNALALAEDVGVLPIGGLAQAA